MDKKLLELELGIRASPPTRLRKNPFGPEYPTKYDIEEKMKEDYLKRLMEDSEE